jgi:2-C-methyl-D-erythritol 4-phosphate cytidylyltransferase
MKFITYRLSNLLTKVNGCNEAAYKKNFGADESMLVKKIGKEIFIAEGSSLNFKITTKEDIEIFKSSKKIL